MLLYNHFLAIDDVHTLLRRSEPATVKVIINARSAVVSGFDVIYSRTLHWQDIQEILPSICRLVCVQSFFWHIKYGFLCVNTFKTKRASAWRYRI